MRYEAKDKKIEELIPLMKGQNHKTFYLDKETKVIISLIKKCSACGCWFKHTDMEGVNCWSCVEHGNIGEAQDVDREPQDCERIADGGI